MSNKTEGERIQRLELAMYTLACAYSSGNGEHVFTVAESLVKEFKGCLAERPATEFTTASETGTECHDEPTRFVDGVRGCSRCGVLWRASRYTNCVKCGGPASHEGRLPLDDLTWIPMENPPPGPPTPPTPFTGPREVA